MTPLAILKDSIRENRDSKILLVLMIFSLVFSFFLLGMSFEPVAADKIIGKSNEFLSVLAHNKGKSVGLAKFNIDPKVSDFKEVIPARNPANGKYSFVLTIETGDRSLPVVPFGIGFTKNKKILPAEVLKDFEDRKVGVGTDIDPFAFAVFVWYTDILGERARLMAGLPSELANNKIEVTRDQMESWVKEIYQFHLNAKIEQVTLRPQTKPDEFVFDVETGTSDPRQWPHGMYLFFGGIDLREDFPAVPLGLLVFTIENYLINGIGAAVAIFIGIIITAFFIPNMLRKGSIDILLSKPMNRPTLLIYKYLGGLIFMFLFTSVAVGTVYLVLGIRTGLWNPAPLLLIPLLTYSFAVLYAVSTLAAVITRSGIVAMLVTLLLSATLWGLSFTYNRFIEPDKKLPEAEQKRPKIVHVIGDVTDALLPKTRDLDLLTTKALLQVMTETDQKKIRESQMEVNWFATFGVSGLYIFLFVGLACWIFSKKNF